MKISIVTPSYQQVEFIERTISSVLSQTGDFKLEYIIIDGGSTDGSVDIIKQYADKDDRIQWVSEKDSGQSNAINKGMRRATGDVVAFLNSDDTYQPGALQLVVDYFKGNPETQWVYGQCKIVNTEDIEMRRWITNYKNMLAKRYSYSKLLSENFISQPACFWRRSAMEEIGLINEEEHLVMDYEYWLRLGATYEPGYIANELSTFRFYATSKSGSLFRKQFKRELEVSKEYATKKNMRWPKIVHTFNYYKIITIYSLMSLIKA